MVNATVTTKQTSPEQLTCVIEKSLYITGKSANVPDLQTSQDYQCKRIEWVSYVGSEWTKPGDGLKVSYRNDQSTKLCTSCKLYSHRG